MTTLTVLGSDGMARGVAIRALAGEGAEVTTGGIGDAPAGELVVLAVPYQAALDLVRQYGVELAGRTIVDITNPLKEKLSGLATAPGTSAAEQIAAVAAPGAAVVKAWNTTFAGALAAGSVDGQPLDVFIAGDDADAKARVAAVVESGGSRPIDVGGLAAAQALEAFQFLHITLQFSRGTGFRTAIKLLG